MTDGVLEVLSAPAITHDRLRRLQEILEALQQGSIAEPEAIEKLQAEAPELDAFLTRLRFDPAAIAAWLTLLLALISFLLGHEGTTNVQKVTETVIQQCVHHPQTSRLPRAP